MLKEFFILYTKMPFASYIVDNLTVPLRTIKDLLFQNLRMGHLCLRYMFLWYELTIDHEQKTVNNEP